jgi:hypothetical protein
LLPTETSTLFYRSFGYHRVDFRLIDPMTEPLYDDNWVSAPEIPGQNQALTTEHPSRFWLTIALILPTGSMTTISGDVSETRCPILMSPGI